VKPKSKILIIAGSDSSGGAGIQADIKTVTALGSYAMTAITAITVQNTTGVSSVVPIQAKEIGKQILFTCKDIKPDAIKIGMLHSSEVIMSVVSALKKVKISKIVLDPVMIAKSGAKLINQRAIKWIDYIKENCIDALKKYCEDQASNDLTVEEKQDARDYLENYIKTEVTKHFGCGVDDDHPYAIDDNGTDQEALENIVMEIIFIYNHQKERVFDRLRKSFES